MSLQSLPAVITLLIALSVATERAVEIVKSLIPWLDTINPTPAIEGRRRATIQALAVVFGVVIAYFTWPVIAEVIRTPGEATPPMDVATVLALGLLASGGSGFWNSLLSYTVSLKSLKSTEARERAERVGTATVIPHPDEGTLTP
jgi:hypothetical protein